MAAPRHIYLSPHLDDAAFSCGGSIHQQRRGREDVVVVTVFAAAPASDEPLSPLARALHARMATRPGEGVVATRRREDRAAMAVLGAGALWLDFAESLYRGHAATRAWRYRHIRELFGDVHPADEALVEAVADAVTGAVASGARPTLYAPLGAGGHVDHQIVHRAGWLLHERGWPVLFYEDFPYSEPGQAEPRAADAEHPLRIALAASRGLEPRPRHLGEDDMHARIHSAYAYDSQLELVFGSRHGVAERIRAYAAQCGTCGPAERFWAPA